MGLPTLNFSFSTVASTAIARSQKGTVAMILKDTKDTGKVFTLTKASQVSTLLTNLGTDNQDYVKRAFIGYINPPKKVIVYVLDSAETSLADALNYFAGQKIDYIVGTPTCTVAEATEITTWVKAERLIGFIPKAVLPNTAANDESIINFTADDIVVGIKTFTSAEYCSRIAGILAGTPFTMSSTYAVLPEIISVAKLSKDELDDAIDAGEFVLFFDGEKVKVGRGVNSLTTTTDSKGEAFKKIKIIEIMDLINNDIRKTASDVYIGKYNADYDNKCLLISAIKDYLTSLENSGILENGKSTVGIDTDAVEAYLKSKNINTDDMSEDELKVIKTDDKVFLKSTISILDAIEDITLKFII